MAGKGFFKGPRMRSVRVTEGCSAFSNHLRDAGGRAPTQNLGLKVIEWIRLSVLSLPAIRVTTRIGLIVYSSASNARGIEAASQLF